MMLSNILSGGIVDHVYNLLRLDIPKQIAGHDVYERAADSLAIVNTMIFMVAGFLVRLDAEPRLDLTPSEWPL